MDSAGISFSTLFNESPPHSGKGTEYNKIKAQDEADLQAKRSVFEDHFKPPTGRKRHSRTAVLLLYWEKNDINVGTEVEDLGGVFKRTFNFEAETFRIRSQEHPNPHLQLEKALIQFIHNHAGPSTLYIIYYAGHGWIKTFESEDDDDKDLKLGAQTTPAALASPKENQLVWMNVEKVLHKRQADILLIFDCCYAGHLRKSYRGAHTFEFLGACDEDERTFGPGSKSFTKFLIRALEELAKDEQGFNTRTLLSKIKNYESFPATDLTPVLFHRDFRSTLHIWIEPVPSDEGTRSTNLEADQLNEQKTDTTTNPEWLEFSFVFNRPQEPDDIKKLAGSLTDFAANHTFHGLERVTLQAKSPNPRLGWPYPAQWLDKVRRKSSPGDRPDPTAPAHILIQESPVSEPLTNITPRMPQDDSRIQAPATPISGADGLLSDYSSDPEPIRKRKLGHVDGAESDIPKLRHSKRQRNKAK